MYFVRKGKYQHEVVLTGKDGNEPPMHTVPVWPRFLDESADRRQNVCTTNAGSSIGLRGPGRMIASFRSPGRCISPVVLKLLKNQILSSPCLIITKVVLLNPRYLMTLTFEALCIFSDILLYGLYHDFSHSYRSDIVNPACFFCYRSGTMGEGRRARASQGKGGRRGRETCARDVGER